MTRCLIIVCGLPGGGKSYFSKHLMKRFENGLYISSDGLRKALGLMGKYSATDKQTVYNALARQAGDALRQGFPVVLAEATFYRRDLRDKLKSVAVSCGACYAIMEIGATTATMTKRVQRPRAESEADLAVHQLIEQQYEAVSGPHLYLSSEQDIEQMVFEAMTYLKEVCQCGQST